MAANEPEKKNGDPERKKLHRSPAYPSFSLTRALGHIQTIYNHEKRSAAPVAVVAQHCDADIKSSKGMRLIAALKQYGLVAEVGAGDDRQVKLSDRALDILLAESENSPERLKAIRDAALAPPIHRKIWDYYQGVLPSDATLQSYLIRTLNFNDTYAGGFIKQFRATLALAKVTENDTISKDETDSEEDDGMTETLENPTDKPKDKLPTAGAGLKDFPLYTSGPKGALYAPAKMNKTDFELFKKQLESYLLVIEATSVEPN